MKSRVLFWTVFLLMLAVDQGVKAWVRGAFYEHEAPGYPWPGVFEITLTYNKGIAFGMLQGFGVVLAPIAIAMAAVAAIYTYRHPKESLWIHASMALLSAGALGNLYDRLILGKVTDMFWFRAIDFPVFNVADACITVAAVILIFRWLYEAIRGPQPAAIDAETVGPLDPTSSEPPTQAPAQP